MPAHILIRTSRSCGCSAARLEFRIGGERRVLNAGEVAVIPGGAEHEGWFQEDTEVVDIFVPPREDFLGGATPAYMRET